ncbi:MAG: Crp/Fnr family transcriptional regulator [Hyphomicrobiaceae bacterium]|nr:MAG: Crp/Fnr family transcriptional regulator [Hyphomicrobiaceae bacterium]
MRKRNACTICAVRQKALCRGLPEDQQGRLNRTAYHRHYDAGRFISGADQRQDWFATVLSGVIKLTKSLPDGRQQIVGLLFPADFLGRPFRGRSPFTAEAATAVELCCLDRCHFEDLLQKTPGLSQLFLERTLDEVDAAREWMFLLGRKTAEEKVASLILLVARRLRRAGADGGAERPAVHWDFPLSRTEMAEYLGLRIETVSRQIRALRSAGAIEVAEGRAIIVRDLAALERMAQKECE